MEAGAINVNVGAVNHPMAPEHFIEWVYVQTEKGGRRKALKPGDDPNVTFSPGDDGVKETQRRICAECEKIQQQ